MAGPKLHQSCFLIGTEPYFSRVLQYCIFAQNLEALGMCSKTEIISLHKHYFSLTHYVCVVISLQIYSAQEFDTQYQKRKYFQNLGKHVLKYIHEQFALRDEELGSGECAETLIRCDEEQNTKPEKKIMTFRWNQ